MKKEFVPYDIALSAKMLDFKEDCFGCYTYEKQLSLDYSDNRNKGHYFQDCAAPLHQQLFRWLLEEKVDKEDYMITRSAGDTDKFDARVYVDKKGWVFVTQQVSHKECENECLRKLIDIVKNKK